MDFPGLNSRSSRSRCATPPRETGLAIGKSLSPLRGAVIGAAILMAYAGSAFSQGAPSPFTGTWRGELTTSTLVTCGNSPTRTCQYRSPWQATIDASGISRGTYGPEVITCDGQPAGTNPAVSYNHPIPSSGLDPRAWTRLNGTCNLPAQYTTTPSLMMSGELAIPNTCPTYSAQVGSTMCTYTDTQWKISGIGTQPVFPMTVTSNITATTATASADIQFRPQDVGTNGSIYTFAVAPATLVKDGLLPKAMFIGYAKSEVKADPPPVCVLAQLSSTGQLVAVTAAQLQAYLSGTLSAQGASVNILNGVSTPTVAGATFYVGYGASSTAMINEGVYRSAVTVPGASVCPMLSSQTALWWNPAESGWGLNLNHQGNIIFATLFTYDATRTPLWLVMSNGAMQSDGVTFSGDLYRTTGPAFDANPFTPIGAANLTKVGTMTVSFADVNAGTLRYTVNGVEVNKAIQRQVYGTRAASCFPTVGSRLGVTNYQDLWWNAAESGWGVNVTHQDNTLFATLFTYDATGRDLWLVMSAGQRQPDGSYLGDLFRTSGPAFNAVPFTPIGAADVTTLGTMRLRFSNGENGTLTYTYNGKTVTKAITRQAFSSPVPLCN